ncbi:hypothetical protein NP590_15055 [Methylomonas sp. SURF-2]|uniref:Uncharacterized protein n=1 Tax=Methylomonas subterranea TaxID=2952225 RepID=A0ABT1TIY6_9GAMM|nr:hypothetical protein [Methylomonas sp. SURF-2]MCQ8105433.1 hypothetical protein [Methylomonas sp. SURF-2]
MSEALAITQLLETSNKLSAFCTQNGWIISDSIAYEILERRTDRLLIYVTFLESIMEGSGCQCDQKACYGRLWLNLNAKGDIAGVELA